MIMALGWSMTGIGFSGLPNKFVLDRLGGELRRLYEPILAEVPPEPIRALLAALKF